MLSTKEAKTISKNGMQHLEYIVNEIATGRMFSEDIINNLLEIIEIERLDAATMVIDKFNT